MLMALLNWLKSMFFALMAITVNVASLVWTLVMGVVKAAAGVIVAPFMALGSVLSSTLGTVLGVSVAATAAPVAAAVTGVVATGATVTLMATIVTGVIDNTALTDGTRDSAHDACTVAAPRTGDSGPGAVVTANTEANAKIVFSVLKSWGMSEANIAGILGNWSRESGVDPTSVESIFSEPYRIGPLKKAAWTGNFTQIPGQSHGGIGLGQWSNGRTMMLLDYAKANNAAWYTIEAQLAFMLQGDDPADVAVFKNMLTVPQASPSAAAYHFHSAWERSADGASRTALRAEAAEMWFGKMSGWKADHSVTGGVQDIVGDVVGSLGTTTGTMTGHCARGDTNGDAGGVAPKNGGMTRTEAQELVDLFNREGDKFLDERYGEAGGPGSCGDNHAENCVSFSTYFVNKYTTFQTYPQGDGIRTAYTIAQQTGKQVTTTPTPYAIGSGPGSGPAGHTLVVLGVQGDTVIVGEAGYCAFMGRVRLASGSEMTAAGWRFVDMTDLMLPADKIKKS
ncbi:phage tail tip lysozyme [Amycolatopsis sp. PS_44_ISF1]|uniref:phage tail tip lysozyme n=1 Tax=Amycolatopsis sp. PS_44_ISF1 TaxID=2974917 RepID=UPI0028DEB063|nr:phage tail tip lysozyme [Amycolatopsis sp. PS_44_ISF1]MDT8913567.1 phage tail tip lysozyme [Amycolatopsis sp. PS_44_ISF1]